MSLEKCILCSDEVPAWSSINGTICHDCYEEAIIAKNNELYWRHVEDELPEVEKEVLCVYLDSDHKMEIAILSILAPAFRFVQESNGIEYLGFWENGDYSDLKKEDVIYWMPLPEPPK